MRLIHRVGTLPDEHFIVLADQKEGGRLPGVLTLNSLSDVLVELVMVAGESAIVPHILKLPGEKAIESYICRRLGVLASRDKHDAGLDLVRIFPRCGLTVFVIERAILIVSLL